MQLKENLIKLAKILRQQYAYHRLYKDLYNNTDILLLNSLIGYTISDLRNAERLPEEYITRNKKNQKQ